ncbi:hypothetical protein [Vibrio harveyi]|uniref:hypothetical protein n=1 Tax=Vibrio harveyi TaxID=669 RepID=UPI00217D85BF|nr:hypothetical protein [Vibrio harveyi]
MGDVFVNGGVDEEGNKIKAKLKPQMFYRKGRNPITPEMFLEVFPEFDSAFSMLNELSVLPDKKRAAKAMAKVNMRDKYGDLSTDSKLYEQAVISAHDDVVAEGMLKEINILAPQVGANTTTQKIFKTAADRIIGGLKIANINPHNYRRAEIKHGNLAFKAMQAGDLKTAKQEREKQLLNFHLYRNAVKVRNFADKSFKLARSMDTGGRLKTLQKAGDHYLGQMQAILSQYEFKKLSKKALLRRQRMMDWLNQTMESAGIGNPEVKSDVDTDQDKEFKEQQAAEDGQISGADYGSAGNQSEIINYKELTPSELDAVMSMIKTIYQQAKLKDKLLTSKDKREFTRARDDLVDSILENKKGRSGISSESNQTFSDTVKNATDSFLLSSRIPTSLIKEMDGFKDNGQAWQLLAKPINEGKAEATDRLEKAKGELERIYKDSYTEAELSKMNTKVFDSLTGRDWSRSDVVGILLNWGNDTNRMRVKDGFRLSDGDVSHLFDKYLSDNDFKFAGEMWAHLETYWDSAVALHKDFYGYTPEKVQASPFRTKYGMMAGGYFPIVYNNNKSVRAEENLIKTEQSSQAALGTKKKMGSTQGRTQRGLMAELNLNFTQVIYGHVSDVVRETSMQRAIYDAGRLLSDKRVAGAIREKYGPNFYKSLTNAIKEVRDGIEEARGAEDKIISKIRNNATIAMLGFKIKTVLMQPLGMTNTYARARLSGIPRAGMMLLNETGKTMISPIKEGDKVANLSPYMKHRMISQNAEISRLAKTMRSNIISSSKLGKAYDWTKEASMIPLQKAQYYAVDVPTWNTAYKHFKGIHDKETAIQLADQFVKDAQGGGDILDIASSMRGNSYKKLFTNFLSYALTTYNLQVQNMKQKPKNGESEILGKVINTFALLVAPAIFDVLLQSMISGGAPEDGEELLSEYAKAQAGFLMGMNPLTAQFSGVVSGYDYSGPQGLTLISRTGALTKQMAQGEADDALTRSTIDFIGLATGLPSGQVNKTVFVWH